MIIQVKMWKYFFPICLNKYTVDFLHEWKNPIIYECNVLGTLWMKLKLYNVENMYNNSLSRCWCIQRLDTKKEFISRAIGTDSSWGKLEKWSHMILVTKLHYPLYWWHNGCIVLTHSFLVENVPFILWEQFQLECSANFSRRHAGSRYHWCTLGPPIIKAFWGGLLTQSMM